MLSRPPAAGRGGPGQKEKSHTLIWVAVGAVVFLIAAAVILAIRTTSGAAGMNEETLCEDAGPTSVTTLLIDATDSISELQRLAVSNRLSRIVADLRRNERIDIFTIRPGADLLTPVFSKCRPTIGAETSEMVGNKAQADRHFNERFKPALDRTLDALLAQHGADRSPIMESVQAASVRSLQAPDLRTEDPGFRRRLVIVSDMLQHSDTSSHLKTMPEWTSFRASPQMKSAASDLSNAEVIILYLHRDGSPVQGRRHVNFWTAWFGEQGAVVENAVPIEG